ncbi:MAG TPA: bifunctional diaminohydroxyphosphoribosylaminopyrimidine deaminase/5-amino-6-(5-phosphoribosylamino)uracil reductase RibD [Acidimicrobiia bacterium]|nr:bifunctional diaminohydroxyphosphoribosylaminopyrimidine deaminase/5-amino-6-(5-phosphoribosylamino)uracil reductase RibD [Acidimicrobiia bacterium]
MSRRAQSDNRAEPRHSLSPLERAFALAAPHHPHPNPRVGAVILDAEGAVVGEGAHEMAGGPHAEIVALEEAGSRAAGGTAYVTLEPCNHHGRTPPCTEALIQAGVATVVVAVADPDLRVAGTGIDRLRAAGLEVVADADVIGGEALDPGYFHHRRTGRPRVTVKLAATIDGQTAAADGSSQWITSEQARHDVHLLRERSDAVMVGAGTLRTDDPRLDVRLGDPARRQPAAVIVAGSRPLPARAKLYDRQPLIYRHDRLGDEPPGAEVVTVPGVAGVDLGAVVKDLGGRGIVDLLVEGGAHLAGALLRGGHADRVVVYLGAKLALGTGVPMLGGVWETLHDAVSVDIVDVTRLGPDVRITAEPRSSA